MKHLDLFSGIGGFALALREAYGDEYVNIGHCEINEHACSVYHRHFAGSQCLGDITKTKWVMGQADIITGGFPCQPHSMAGKRLASKDRRDLWYECKRAVGEIRPRYALFENVAGLLTSERGEFFNRVLSDLAEIGYDAEWHSIPASAVGAPHRRERIWIIAYPSKELANADGERYIHGESEVLTAEEWLNAFRNAPANDTEATDADHIGVRPPQGQGEIESARSGWKQHWYEVATRLCRVDDGISAGVDKRERIQRLKGLGNAIVPQVAFAIAMAMRGRGS